MTKPETIISKCQICKHRNPNATCPANLCFLESILPSVACAAIKHKDNDWGCEATDDLTQLSYCRRFEEGEIE